MTVQIVLGYTPYWPTELLPPMTRAESPLKLTLESKVGFNPAPRGFGANNGITAVTKVRGRDAASSSLIEDGICTSRKVRICSRSPKLE